LSRHTQAVQVSARIACRRDADFSAWQLAAQSSAPPDADLYYRRTHDGALPPPGTNLSDHSGETTNIVKAGSVLTQKSARPQTLLFSNIDPANLGKGDWIWQMPQTETHLGVSDVQSVINYETNLHMQWITVKCGDGGSIYSQFNSDLITRAHAAGLKIFGWAYAYGNNSGAYGSTSSANVTGEINVALNALALGADGFIIDAEIEYQTNATRVADATLYAGTIKSNYPTLFLAHAPFPYINSHSGFPYTQFGIYCDAVMPQDYWGAIGISPQTMVVNMNSQWRSWQNSLTGSNTNAIKPIVPLGQSYSPVTGAQITQFLYALQTNSPKATVTGYNGVSFWDAQERTADMDSAILAASIGTNAQPPFASISPQLQRVADTGGSVSFTATASGTPPINYQWLLNGTPIPGATTNFYNITNAQTNNAGNYSVLVGNSFGTNTSTAVSLAVYPPQATVFSDSFDSNTATNWIVNKSSGDNSVTFNFDYSTLGIPSAPHSTGGTTLGVQMKANLSLGVVAALSISPTNQSFSGDYRVHFDAWINVNGPLPGGGGSTEFLTAGIGTSGTRTEWTGSGSTADGFYFSADGDGGVSSTSTTSGDYSGYIGTAWQNAASGIYAAGSLDNTSTYYLTAFPTGQSAPALQQSNYPQQTGALNAGTFGLAWHDVIISRRGNTVNWSVDGISFATISNATFTASNVFVGYWDPFASLSSNNAVNFGLVDNVRVEVPAVAPAITAQPQITWAAVGSNAMFSVTATGLPVPAYQWIFNAVAIGGATNATFTVTNIQSGNAGNYSVVVTNIAGSTVSSNALLAIIASQPAQFQLVSLQPGAGLSLVASGQTNATYIIETSTNLLNWTALTNLLLATNGIFEFDANPATNEQLFFRARSGP
jgi:hypothetical protein